MDKKSVRIKSTNIPRDAAVYSVVLFAAVAFVGKSILEAERDRYRWVYPFSPYTDQDSWNVGWCTILHYALDVAQRHPQAAEWFICGPLMLMVLCVGCFVLHLVREAS